MRRHTIDVVFSLSLFLVFVLSSFLLLLFQINGYHELQYDSNNVTTASSYLQTELRHNDRAKGIDVVQVDGVSCLKVKQVEGVSYYYVYQDSLMELYQDEALQVDLSLGEKRFSCEQIVFRLQEDTLRIDLTVNDEQATLVYQLKGGKTIS